MVEEALFKGQASAFIKDKDAEELKISADKERAEKVLVAIEPVLTKLAKEVRTSFDYFESRSVTSVERIFLSGGASQYQGLRDSLSAAMGIVVENWDPLRKITLGAGLDPQKVKAVSGQLAVAIGLALRS